MPSRGPGYEEIPFKSARVSRIGQDVDAGRKYYKVRYSGFLIAPDTGTYRIGLKGMFAKLTFNGERLADLEGYPPPQLGELKVVHLEKGHHYPVEIEVTKNLAMSAQWVWSRISEDASTAIRDAAKDVDVIVVAVGLNADLESEESSLVAPGFSHGDRTSLDLPADQQKLLEAAKTTERCSIHSDTD